MIDEPLEQFVAHGRAGSPDAGWNFRCVAQQADRAFRNHLRRRSTTGVAIAADRDADLTAIRRETEEQKIVKAGLTFFFRRPFARLRSPAANPLGIDGRDETFGVAFA